MVAGRARSIAGFRERRDDVLEIQGVARTTWDHTYRETIPERVRDELVSRAYSADSLRHRIGSSVFLIAPRAGSVVGFADFQPLHETRVDLAAVYVLPEMQGCGIGTRLLMAGLARFSPGTEFVLRVERDNAPALRFYEARRSRDFTERLFEHYFHDLEMVLPAREPAPRPTSRPPQGAGARRRK